MIRAKLLKVWLTILGVLVTGFVVGHARASAYTGLIRCDAPPDANDQTHSVFMSATRDANWPDYLNVRVRTPLEGTFILTLADDFPGAPYYTVVTDHDGGYNSNTTWLYTDFVYAPWTNSHILRGRHFARDGNQPNWAQPPGNAGCSSQNSALIGPG